MGWVGCGLGMQGRGLRSVEFGSSLGARPLQLVHAQAHQRLHDEMGTVFGNEASSGTCMPVLWGVNVVQRVSRALAMVLAQTLTTTLTLTRTLTRTLNLAPIPKP